MLALKLSGNGAALNSRWSWLAQAIASSIIMMTAVSILTAPPHFLAIGIPGIPVLAIVFIRAGRRFREVAQRLVQDVCDLLQAGEIKSSLAKLVVG